MDLLVMRSWILARAHRSLGERGAAMVEYILLVALIALVVLVAVQFFGNETSSKYDGTTSQLFSG